MKKEIVTYFYFFKRKNKIRNKTLGNSFLKEKQNPRKPSLDPKIWLLINKVLRDSTRLGPKQVFTKQVIETMTIH